MRCLYRVARAVSLAVAVAAMAALAGGCKLKGAIAEGEQGSMNDVHFAYNEATIRPQDELILRWDASWLRDHPDLHVQVEGYCDERGPEGHNIILGGNRAQAAKDYLIGLGIPPTQIATVSYGKEMPLCTEHDENCWSKNRRDHFTILPVK
jgi:peptidoglycan-associated lipoprotein